MTRFIAFCSLFLVTILLLAGCTSDFYGLFSGFRSNSERIYFSGTSANGPISYSGGDFSGMMGRGMMGAMRLACADCHGADARGGEHVMHMQVMKAPDIRWSSLTMGEGGATQHNSAGGGQAMEHPPYTPETFARAVREGVDPAGKPLDTAMPRWQMANQDTIDLIEFLKTK